MSDVLLLSSVLLTLGLFGVVANRHNLVVVLMSIELILLAADINFVAFSFHLSDIKGQIFVFFVLAVAAAEAAVGLAILVALFRRRKTVSVEALNTLEG